ALSQMFLAIALCFLHRWTSSSQPRHWLGMALAFALALLTKLTTIVLLPVIAVAVALSRISRSWRALARVSAWFLATIMVVDGYYLWFRFGTPENRMGVPHVPAFFGLEGAAPYWFLFSPSRLASRPFVVHGDHEYMSYFLEFIFRSSLFSEIDFGEPYYLTAYLLMLVFGGILALGLWELLRRTLARDHEALLLSAFWLSSLLALGGFRWMAAASVSQDFRYVLGMLIPAAIGWGSWVAHARPVMRRKMIGLTFAGGGLSVYWMVRLAAFQPEFGKHWMLQGQGLLW
ncbi:MAG: glycosyltransferase family 39 protein, partial [Bdellovibrionales bacterium]|nr:glycosyltransferase family 39 protein [Bdellovibrionales bacterium]